MARVVNEQKRYKREDLEALAGFAAKAEIIGGMYIGDFGEQTFEWLTDGSLVVVTTHQPAEVGDWKQQGRSK